MQWWPNAIDMVHLQISVCCYAMCKLEPGTQPRPRVLPESDTDEGGGRDFLFHGLRGERGEGLLIIDYRSPSQ